jgi:hypothetical protein
MNRRKAELQAIDLGQWPTVAYTDFDPRAKTAFQTRMLRSSSMQTGEPSKASGSSMGLTAASFIDGLTERLLNMTMGESMVIAG